MGYSRILRVVTPAANQLLVSLADAKDELGITDASLDARITRWIKAASGEIVDYIDRPQIAETVEETIRADSQGSEAPGEHYWPRLSYGSYGSNSAPTVPGLRLARYPILAVTSIIEDGTTLVAGTDYEIDADYGLIYRLSGTMRVRWYGQVIVVTYTGGYLDTTTIPDNMQTACFLLLRYRQSARSRDPMLKEMSVPGVLERQIYETSVSVGKSLPDDVIDLIDGYRDLRL